MAVCYCGKAYLLHKGGGWYVCPKCGCRYRGKRPYKPCNTCYDHMLFMW